MQTYVCTLSKTLNEFMLGSSLSHYDDVIMSEIASQITSLTIVYSTVHLGADQSKHQSSASLAFVWEIHRWPVNFPHKWPVTRKIFPFDDVIMVYCIYAHTTRQWFPTLMLVIIIPLKFILIIYSWFNINKYRLTMTYFIVVLVSDNDMKLRYQCYVRITTVLWM